MKYNIMTSDHAEIMKRLVYVQLLIDVQWCIARLLIRGCLRCSRIRMYSGVRPTSWHKGPTGQGISRSNASIDSARMHLMCRQTICIRITRGPGAVDACRARFRANTQFAQLIRPGCLIGKIIVAAPLSTKRTLSIN